MDARGRLPLNLIVAMTPSRVIGREGKIPWKLSEDMKYFKATTMGHAIIMGRKTAESLGRPLPGRRNIFISRNFDKEIEGFESVSTLEMSMSTLEFAIARARDTDPEPFIIGGAEIYELAMRHVTKMYVSITVDEYEGDTYFPKIDYTVWRTEKSSFQYGSGFVATVLVRR